MRKNLGESIDLDLDLLKLSPSVTFTVKQIILII